MRRYLKDSLSPSMGVALVALLLALSGTSYAAVTLGHGSAGRTELRAASGQPVLGSGQVMRGYFAAAAGDSTSGYAADAITFPKKLPSGFNNNHVQYIAQGDPTTTHCPGVNRAKRNWMCFYVGQQNAVTLCCIYDQNYGDPAVSDYGARIYWNPNASDNYVDGTWVVRAP